jgi:hypothetical protein
MDLQPASAVDNRNGSINKKNELRENQRSEETKSYPQDAFKENP